MFLVDQILSVDSLKYVTKSKIEIFGHNVSTILTPNLVIVVPIDPIFTCCVIQIYYPVEFFNSGTIQFLFKSARLLMTMGNNTIVTLPCYCFGFLSVAIGFLLKSIKLKKVLLSGKVD